MTSHSISIGRAVARPQLALGSAGVAGILVGAHVANDALTSMLSALLPSIQSRTYVSDSTLALLVATLAFSASVTQPVLGVVSDRVGPRLVAAVGTVLGVSLLSLMTVAPNVSVLFALLLVGGLGSAAFHPAATSLLAGLPLRRRELSVGLFSAGGTVGLAVGPLVVLAAGATLGLGFTPWLVVPAVGLGLVMYRLVPDPRRTPRPPRTRSFDTALVRGPVGRLAAAATLASLAFVAFSAAYPLYLVREHGVGPSDPLIGLTLSAFNLGAATGAVVAGGLATRVAARVIVGFSLAGSLVPLGLLLVVAPGGPLYLVTVAAAGGLLNANLPVLLVAAQRLAPDRTAAASGMLLGLPIGLAGLLYVGVGHLQETLGLVPSIAVAFIAVLPGTALAVATLGREAPGRRTGTAPSVDACACSVVRGPAQMPPAP